MPTSAAALPSSRARAKACVDSTADSSTSAAASPSYGKRERNCAKYSRCSPTRFDIDVTWSSASSSVGDSATTNPNTLTAVSTNASSITRYRRNPSSLNVPPMVSSMNGTARAAARLLCCRASRSEERPHSPATQLIKPSNRSVYPGHCSQNSGGAQCGEQSEVKTIDRPGAVFTGSDKRIAVDGGGNHGTVLRDDAVVSQERRPGIAGTTESRVSSIDDGGNDPSRCSRRDRLRPASSRAVPRRSRSWRKAARAWNPENER